MNSRFYTASYSLLPPLSIEEVKRQLNEHLEPTLRLALKHEEVKRQLNGGGAARRRLGLLRARKTRDNRKTTLLGVQINNIDYERKSRDN